MANTYTLINSNTVGSGGAATVTFSSIPATYTDLHLVCSARGGSANPYSSIYLSLNNSTSTYSYKELQGSGSAASSSGNTTQYFSVVNGQTSTASTFGNASFYIPNYAGSNYKSISTETVTENNATAAYATMVADLWSTTTAVSSIVISGAGNFDQYSTFYLYGIKNS